MSPHSFLEIFSGEPILLPIAIFFARILDVSVGTVRIVMVARGHKIGASLLGFVECLLWTLAVSQLLADMRDPIRYLAFAAGFATGNYVGLKIEERIALGLAVIRVITRQGTAALSEALRNSGFGLTLVDGTGREGKVDIIFSIVKRKRLQGFVAVLNRMDPNAFYSV
ncbi:MAG TPA: DUF5698 domain-containing protein, partial [bacterium]|nr:DUF5698 domain-containing protein [bacterium]